MKRLTLVGIILGGLLVVVGLVVIGSTLGQTDADETRVGGMLLMSFGAMAAAIPMFVEVRHERAKKAESPTANDPRLRCFNCGSAVATMRCQKHMVRLCADCVSTHDEGAQCFYVPLSRYQKES